MPEHDFSDALIALKAGHKVARATWNPHKTWLRLIPENQWTAPGETPPVRMRAFIGMHTADDSFVPWTASSIELLAKNWVILPE
jgi:hypothetical protein